MPKKLNPNPRDVRGGRVSSSPDNAESGSSLSDARAETSSVYSSVSVTSSYRHHNAGPFMPQAVDPPQPVLSKDTQHVPKTVGCVGLMVVGLGGANGTTMLAGILANRLNIEWFGPRGEPMTPNYYGCITQLDQKGGGVGYRNRVKGLADASMAAVGGWVRTEWGVGRLEEIDPGRENRSAN
jgi:hypothetical protein